MTHVFAALSPAMRPLSAAAIAGSLVPLLVVLEFDCDADGAAPSARCVLLAELHAEANSIIASAAPKLTVAFGIG